jgi:hypothetical protein
MAKVKLNGPFAEISGSMGDFVFRKGKKEGEAILAKRPKKSTKPSKAQQAQWDRFTEASVYAREAKANPEVWAYYEAEAQKLGLQTHIAAMTGYLNGKNLLSK